MTLPRRLALKLALSVLVAFVIVLIPLWFLQDYMAERDAYQEISETLEDVLADMDDQADTYLIRMAMTARDAVKKMDDLSVPKLRALADSLGVDEICLVDAKGILTHSARSEDIGLDFNKVGGQAAEFLCLLKDETEFAQPFCQISLKGKNESRKYVGVWRPEGGFVQVGCLAPTLRALIQSELTGITHNWHIGAHGSIFVVTQAGRIISATDPELDGSLWKTPGNDMYWRSAERDGFTVYGVVPKASAAIERNVSLGIGSVFVGGALILLTIFVALVIAGFVKAQMAAQAAKDMAMAKEIQEGSLPRTFPPFPDVKEFDVYAQMRTAKEVGGDFYDFYFVGPGHILFLIADVSGKGVPAALFMMKAKSTVKSLATTGRPISEVISAANDALCEGNDANMFVTLWAGVLEIATGRVTCVNAGHNPPFVRMADGSVRMLKGKRGLVLGAMSGIRYVSDEFFLEAGADLYLYTDGITEQPDQSGEMFGEARTQKVLTGAPAALKTVCERMQAAVDAHAASTEQADDCTQLILRYRGGEQKMNKTYVPTMEDLAKATADLEAALEEVPLKTKMQLMVAADEIFANIVRYSHATQWSLKVEFAEHPKSVRLTFADDGAAFDPLEVRDPDTALAAEDRQVGGLGILIVKKTMSPVTYQRKDGRNILTMGKTFE
ncbi:MAG: SpoIIE family protein phosphatase [bacterium]|nr:SpoIIE family protein phosphatase [bacterium]